MFIVLDNNFRKGKEMIKAFRFVMTKSVPHTFFRRNYYGEYERDW